MKKKSIEDSLKNQVYDFWNEAACGEKLYLENLDSDSFKKQANIRYQLEPYILTFAEFDKATGKNVLEIGLGLGADHQQFAEAGANLYGIDITDRAVFMTRERLLLQDLKSCLIQGDAEKLPYKNNSFDLVYSWGVLHHSPNTQCAIDEVYRVLKPGQKAKIMIYHKKSIVGFMLWLRYGLAAGKPFISWDYLYSNYLESPGTKAYSIQEAKKLFQSFANVNISTVLTHGDLLTSQAGQKHESFILDIMRLIWPRKLIKKLFSKNGLFMLIEAYK
ncbi:MAG: class I SAM-dependent methyltransferase [Janthinobacterium lividum]